MGLEAAGFDIAGCVEMDPDARRSLSWNRPHWPLLDLPTDAPGDLLAVSPSDVVEFFDLTPGGVDLLAGGPPCQPFSKSALWVNGKTSQLDDPRTRTLDAYFGVLDAALPRVMLLENVEGFAPRRGSTAPGQALPLIERALAKVNARHGTCYQPSLLRLDAADYGVPQHRRRVFVVAEREGAGLSTPPPTHHEHPAPRKQRWATAWDALADVPSDQSQESLVPTGRWAELLRSIPEGHNYQWHTPGGQGEPLFGWRTRYWSFLLKLAKSQPSWTVQALPGPATGPFHWSSRRLSVRELCELQTFPRDSLVSGGYRAAVRQVGNAVPSAVGELLGLSIRRELFGTRVRRQLRLTPELRPDCPDPEPPAPVPNTYLNLRGTHAAHPGPGNGPGAIRRTPVAQY